MSMKPNLRDWFWILAGSSALLVAGAVMLRAHLESNPAAREALRTKRIELVHRMQLNLSAASEAGQNAVLAITDRESQEYADQARAASQMVEQERDEMGDLLRIAGIRRETELLSQFSGAFADYKRIDHELLDLAVQNTNLKAFSLAFGPAADSVREMDQALSRIMAHEAEAASPAARQEILLAARAQDGALRIQALLPAHISEESDARMDSMEATIARDDREVRESLSGLARLLPPSETPNLDAARTCYARFTGLEARIIALSRQNTNVRSLALSLNQKRRAVVQCEDILAGLEDSIQREPIPDRIPANPR